MANMWPAENVPTPSSHHWPVTLHHHDLLLRPLRLRDKDEWNAVRRANMSWLMPWEATMPPGGEPGPPSFAALVRMLNRQAREGRALPWIVAQEMVEPGGALRRTRQRLVGQLTVTGITRGSANFAQIGYWVDQRLAGQGIIPTAVAMATDYCFTTMRLHRMEIAIRPENTKSLRVVEKLGFRPEGLRPRYLHINGDWRDHLIFALNAEEVPGGVLARWANREHNRPEIAPMIKESQHESGDTP